MLWLLRPGGVRCWPFRKHPKFVLHPFQVDAVLKGGVELLHGLVEDEGCAGRNCGPHLFLSGFWSVGLEDILLHAEFLCLSFWQPVNRFERRCFLYELRFYLFRPFVLPHTPPPCHPHCPT